MVIGDAALMGQRLGRLIPAGPVLCGHEAFRGYDDLPYVSGSCGECDHQLVVLSQLDQCSRQTTGYIRQRHTSCAVRNSRVLFQLPNSPNMHCSGVYSSSLPARMG